MSSLYGKAAVRVSLLHFLFGKALNAVVSLLTLVVLARWMEPEAYGVYIAFLALQSSFLALSSLGIDATVERFIPELRTRHADSELLGFVTTSIGTRLLTLIFIALVAWVAAKPITNLIGLVQHAEVFRCWVWVFLLTGMLTFAVVVLDAMLHQRQSQRCMSIYVVAKLLLVVGAHQYFRLDLDALVNVELVASGLAAFVGCWLLIRHFAVGEVRRGWKVMVDNGSRIKRFAFFNYVAQVVFQFFSVEMMKLLVTRLLGVLHSASYGFACSLAETVQRYLPAVLLLRLIKPVFISRYTKTGDFAQLNSMARIILKINLLMLTPIIAFAAVFGGDLLSLLSNGRYADAHWIAVGILGQLVLSSHQLVLSLLASTLEKNAMQLYAGFVAMIAFPCALLLVPELGPLGAVAASAISSVVYNIFATLYLRRSGFAYRPDLRGGFVFLLAGIASYGSVAYVSNLLTGLAGLLAVVAVGMVSYFSVVRALSAFSNDERELLNSILPRRIFVF